MKHDIVTVEQISDLSSFRRDHRRSLADASLPRTTSPARSTVRCSTTSSASRSGPCTSRSRPSKPGSLARPTFPRTSPATCAPLSRSPEALATPDRLLAWRPAQRLADARPAAHRLGCAATRGRLQDLSPAGHRTTSSELPRQLQLKVICGATGSGKSRILQAIGRLGEQMLDLEELACHKGSVLGVLPDCPQPSQKDVRVASADRAAGLDPTARSMSKRKAARSGRCNCRRP
jgi:hypothetical protein